MADALTNFILKPAASFAAGVVLFTTVWGFFKGVESVLTNDTKLEIAVWLLGVKTAERVQMWPQTFANMFDRVFGAKHLSGRCFLRSCIATMSACICCSVVRTLVVHPQHALFVSLFLTSIPTAAYSALWLFSFDYLSLLETRYVLTLMQRVRRRYALVGFLFLDLIVTGLTGLPPAYYTSFGLTVHPQTTEQLMRKLNATAQPPQRPPQPDQKRGQSSSRRALRPPSPPTHLQAFVTPSAALVVAVAELLWLPTFFTSIWLWLYAGSGFLLKFARHFDIGFDWFNRHFDIEHKPLSAIGLVAGSIVALLWWTVVLVKIVV